MVLFLRIVLGIIYLFSAYSKLYPIELFEHELVNMGLSSWRFSVYFSRVIIGIEIFIGLGLILSLYPRIFAVFSQALLIVFSVFLLLLILQEKGIENCGCFGNKIVLTPQESLWKNLILTILNLPLLFTNKRAWNFKPKWVLTITFLLSFALPFIVNPVQLGSNTPQEGKIELKINKWKPFVHQGNIIEFEQGDKIVVFLSNTCPHCLIVASKLTIMQKKGEIENAYIYLWGDSEKTSRFLKYSRMDLPYQEWNDNDLLEANGGIFPTIYILKEGKLIRVIRNAYFDLNELK
jgi:uncharacterized membrane protein YphA (DoxX/SURF4 family)